jgi:hypothetical protein
MTIRKIFSVAVVALAASAPAVHCQKTKAPGVSPCVVVDVQASSGRLSFVVDGKPVSEPILDFLGKHRKEHAEKACASVFVSREITLGDIGKVQATISKAQYAPVHVYCCSTGGSQVEELTFSAPIPAAQVRDTAGSARRPPTP